MGCCMCPPDPSWARWRQRRCTCLLGRRSARSRPEGGMCRAGRQFSSRRRSLRSQKCPCSGPRVSARPRPRRACRPGPLSAWTRRRRRTRRQGLQPTPRRPPGRRSQEGRPRVSAARTPAGSAWSVLSLASVERERGQGRDLVAEEVAALTGMRVLAAADGRARAPQPLYASRSVGSGAPAALYAPVASTVSAAAEIALPTGCQFQVGGRGRASSGISVCAGGVSDRRAAPA